MASTQMKFFGGKPQIKRPSINPLILVVLVLAIAVIGGGLVLRFIGIEQGRELLSWQNRLTLIADSRASDIDGWLERHFREMDTVTTNPSLQLYLTELMTDPEVKDIPVKDAPVEDPAQVVFLRNLLSITADRLGFVEKASKEIKSIDANVRQPSGVGIAIVDNNGKVLVSTGGLPSLSDDLGHKIEQMPKGQQGLIDIFTAENGANRIGFVLPIYSIQSDNSANQQIGRLVGIKNVDKELSKLLHHPGVTEKTLEAVLLRKEGSNVDYLLSQEGGKAAAAKLALDTPDLDAAFALTSPGAFAEKKDAQSQSTLMTSRALVHAPWVLLLHIDRNQAMADSDA